MISSRRGTTLDQAKSRLHEAHDPQRLSGWPFSSVWCLSDCSTHVSLRCRGRNLKGRGCHRQTVWRRGNATSLCPEARESCQKQRNADVIITGRPRTMDKCGCPSSHPSASATPLGQAIFILLSSLRFPPPPCRREVVKHFT